MRVLILTASLAASGCAWSHSPVPAGRPVRDVYEGTSPEPARALRIDQAPAPGAAERTRPVIYPPKVFAVWVPDHLDLERDFKIGAHYVYIKLRESSWVEEDIDREPFAQAPADPSDLAYLRERLGAGGLARAIVPFESSAPERLSERSRPAGFQPARKDD